MGNNLGVFFLQKWEILQNMGSVKQFTDFILQQKEVRSPRGSLVRRFAHQEVRSPKGFLARESAHQEARSSGGPLVRRLAHQEVHSTGSLLPQEDHSPRACSPGGLLSERFARQEVRSPENSHSGRKGCCQQGPLVTGFNHVHLLSLRQATNFYSIYGVCHQAVMLSQRPVSIR